MNLMRCVAPSLGPFCYLISIKLCHYKYAKLK